MEEYLSSELSRRTILMDLRLWAVICIGVAAVILLILVALSLWLSSRKNSSATATAYEKFKPHQGIPVLSKEIKEVPLSGGGGVVLTIADKSGISSPGLLLHVARTSTSSRGSSEQEYSVKEVQAFRVMKEYSPRPSAASISDVSHLGWGRWYALQELHAATDGFCEENKVGEGGYGVVFKGSMADGSVVAVKSLLNNSGQAEKEFRVEVEAIGKVRHKNLVKLLGYCAEGCYRMLVYEYVDNGNLEHWLHGPKKLTYNFPWEARMKIAMGTAKALAYLHEALEPKVVHRDIKASNILLDCRWNAKVSDFGLAKLLGSEKSHVTTRVMGTFGYVAPEYASTGLLNERSDVYSFGVLLMELITGRDPVDYGRPVEEVNLVDWLKVMVANRNSEEVADPRIQVKPSSRALKKALLVAIRCVDPDSVRRPTMGHVVHMLEADELPFREERKRSQRPPTTRRPPPNTNNLRNGVVHDDSLSKYEV